MIGCYCKSITIFGLKDILFSLVGEASVNDSGLTILLQYAFGLIDRLANLFGAIWAAFSLVLGTWLEVYPS